MTEISENITSDDAGLRIDKWLWYARFFKSRTLAAKIISTKPIRVNSNLISKAHTMIRPGDVLTFPKADHIRVIKVINLGGRRGPAIEARTLYEDLSPPVLTQTNKRTMSPASRPPGSGRPTKAERRATDRLKQTEH
jgi:ribosome-associated heat shock protein Hsp15